MKNMVKYVESKQSHTVNKLVNRFTLLHFDSALVGVAEYLISTIVIVYNDCP